jgi:tRNA threonylcarbamoyladenosine biosynthesis protein TsaE
VTGSRTILVPTSADMRDLGGSIGGGCRGGDVIVLAGDLGAGKTTFTQGLALGLGITEAVTSPTFVISREHANPGNGLALVHVDAYRLGSQWELDDLDLLADPSRSVIVVEWGRGLAEGLSSSRLDIEITRSDDAADESRAVTLTPHAGHWADDVDDAIRKGWSE